MAQEWIHTRRQHAGLWTLWLDYGQEDQPSTIRWLVGRCLMALSTQKGSIVPCKS